VGIPGFQLNTTPKNSGEVHTRPLTAEETQLLFKKLSKCIGRNTKHLIDRSGRRHQILLLPAA
jgi:hypothetical protein